MEGFVWLGIVVAIIVGIIKLIGIVIVFIYTLVLCVSVNPIVAAEKLLGSWACVHPIVSWAVMGFLAGFLLYFAVIESPKLNRPNIKPLLIAACCAFVIFTPVLGPKTDGLSMKFWHHMGTVQTVFGEKNGGVPPAGQQETRSNTEYEDASADGASEDNRRFCKAPNGINLRSGPSADDRIVGTIRHGEEVAILGKEPSQTDGRYFYYKVRTRGGDTGFAWAGKNDEWFQEK